MPRSRLSLTTCGGPHAKSDCRLFFIFLIYFVPVSIPSVSRPIFFLFSYPCCYYYLVLLFFVLHVPPTSSFLFNLIASFFFTLLHAFLLTCMSFYLFSIFFVLPFFSDTSMYTRTKNKIKKQKHHPPVPPKSS